MKGNIDYFGKDRLAYLLYDCGGTTEDEVRASHERLDTYGMRDFDVVRTTMDAMAIELPAKFGHFGYGAMVIDAAGNLRGANLQGHQVFTLLQQLLDPDAAGGDEDEGGAAAMRTSTTVEVTRRGLEGLSLSRVLTRSMTATINLELQLPDGYHVYGTAASNPTPTTVTVRYCAGATVGKAQMLGLQDAGAGQQHAEGPVHIQLPVELPLGTPIGEYVVHGTVRFMACDERQCLPPAELRWHAVIAAR